MIVAKNISKSFDNRKALDNLNFCLNKGDIVSLLGPNGAGKTTLLRILTGYLNQSSGSVEIYGHNPQQERVAVLSKIGYVPENAPLYPEMSVYDFLSFAGHLRHLNGQGLQKALKETIINLQLQNVLNQRIETLSKGFKHRVAIAAALLHRPKILILDEPTEGLDPNQKFEMHKFIRQYGQQSIIIISTHILEEVEAISNRVLLLHKGKLIRDTSPQELKLSGNDFDIASAFRAMTGENENVDR